MQQSSRSRAVYQHIEDWQTKRDSMEFVNPAWVMDDEADISRSALEKVLDKLVVDEPMPAGYYGVHLFKNTGALELYLDHYPG